METVYFFETLTSAYKTTRQKTQYSIEIMDELFLDVMNE